MKPWNEREPEIEAALRICAPAYEHEALRRLDLSAMPQNVQGVVDEIKDVSNVYRQLAVDSLNALAELRKQIIHGGAWTQKVDSIMERATRAGLRQSPAEKAQVVE